MIGNDDPGILNAFLHRLLDDRERGAVQGVDAYQRMFPGSDAAIASEYAAVTGAVAAAASGVEEGQALQQIGPYRLLGKLGHGSFGLVYSAEDTRLHRTVALKVLARAGLETQREREQFEREAAIASRLDHPGICTVYEIARHGLWTCIAMRYVPGETLATRLARAPAEPLPVSTLLSLVEKVARALHVAHTAGVVHRDVKPGNVMVTPAGEPVVVDFGLARDTQSSAAMSATGEHVGSPSYMAPEQLEAGIGPVDARTDVWALGVTLFECLAGVRPFEAPTQTGLFDAILRREPAPLRGRAVPVSRDLAVVVATALAKEPGRRYQSAHALADDLARVQRGEPVLARPIGRFGRLVRWTRRSPAVAALLAAVLLALSAGLVVAGVLWMRAQANLRDWERLADGRRFAQLQKAADEELLPVGPDKVPGIEAWLASARDLLSRRGEHERALLALRERAKPWSASTERLEQQRDWQLQLDRGALLARVEYLNKHLVAFDADPPPPERRGAMRAALLSRIATTTKICEHMSAALDERLCYEFADVRDQLQHDEITELVLALRRLAGEMGPATIRLEAMEQRLEAARTLRQRTIGDHESAWNDAIARIRTNPRYAGVELRPQLGLIPLGPDPESTLEEFASPETGKVPRRRADGRIEVAPDMAVVFVLIPPGKFVMGAQAGDPQALGYDALAVSDEAPVRRIETGVFFLSKYEMTQGQWITAFDENPSYYARGWRDGLAFVDDDHPVETLSYRDCTSKLRRLGWWLPPEAQWEYACRAGTTTAWCCDPDDLPACANLADRTFHAADRSGNPYDDWNDGRMQHAPVGSYRPNNFGLHDMMGNVAEWCYEQFMPYDPARTTAQAVPPVTHINDNVIRGGSWYYPALQARCAARRHYEPTIRTAQLGVRPMRAVTRD